jgi:hypothetical protein
MQRRTLLSLIHLLGATSMATAVVSSSNAAQAPDALRRRVKPVYTLDCHPTPDQIPLACPASPGNPYTTVYATQCNGGLCHCSSSGAVICFGAGSCTSALDLVPRRWILYLD